MRNNGDATLDGRTLLDILDGVRDVLWAVGGEFKGEDEEDFLEAIDRLTRISDRLYEREYGDDRRGSE